MAIEYKKFLAEKVFNEKEPVTYRSLCRALNVHSNLSKQMLYDFHQHENSKKAKSVNATYLIMGIQRESEKSTMNGHHAKDGEDDFMQSSPFMSSMPQHDEPEDKPKVTSVTLVREEDLDKVKSRFEIIFSIHIHSLQPAPLQDLNVLSDVGSETLEAQLKEDPLGQDNKHGMIQNKRVKRRTGIKVSAPPASAQPEKDAKASSKPAAGPKPSAKEEESSQSSKKGGKESQSSEPRGSSQAGSQPTKKPTQSKQEKSDIFKSFAKAKPKAKKPEPEPPATESAGANTAEDAVLDDASEEEREDLFSGTAAKDSDKLRKEKHERAENLKKMMDDDDDDEEDEEMPDAPESPPEEEAPVEAVAEEPRKSEPREEVEVQAGRRRGRRQVMKKKVVKDEEGYLVTREEPTWEEFSEEEKPPPKKKPAVSVKPPPKSSKGGGKAGQGNIMSFFSKK